jgi:predicted NAD-dependent protein-ADP-ribosyltransferase YbiA (DUF1768 family)
MDIKSGNVYPAGALSNFAPHPFIFRNIPCNSMEGFLQGLKFKNADMQTHTCSLVGRAAKAHGRNKNWQTTQTLWWQGEPIKRESDEYQDLLDEAFNAMFDQNKKAQKALLATKNAKLKHSIGRSKKNETVLTTQEFCSRLMSIRSRIVAQELVDF